MIKEFDITSGGKGFFSTLSDIGFGDFSGIDNLSVYYGSDEILQPDKCDCLLDILLAGRFVVDVQTAEVVDVFVDGQLVEHGDILHDDTDLLLDIVGSRRHFFAEDFNAALVEGEQRKQAVDGCGLACAILTQKTEDAAFGHIETQVFVNLPFPIVMGQVDALDDVFHYSSVTGTIS